MTIKLDIGSGGKSKLGEGWLGVDPYVKDADISAFMWELPFNDNSVDAIFSSHALEHCPKNMVIPTLLEWKRVIKQGAPIIIRIPDLEWCCLYWLSHQGTGWEMDIIFGGQNHEGEFHKTGFTYNIMCMYLKEAGLTLKKFEILWTHGQKTLSFEVTK